MEMPVVIGDERVINLQRTKVYVFSDSVLRFGKIFENPESDEAWEQGLGLVKIFQNYRNFDRIDGEPMEFEWHIFPGFDTLQLNEDVKSLLLRLNETPENFTGRTWGSKDIEQDARQMLNSFLFFMQEDSKQDNGHSLDLDLKRSGVLSVETVHKKYGDNMAERMMITLAESGQPVF